jgi:hypothetical protein
MKQIYSMIYIYMWIIEYAPPTLSTHFKTPNLTLRLATSRLPDLETYFTIVIILLVVKLSP